MFIKHTKCVRSGLSQTNKAVQHETEFLRNRARGALGQQYPGQLLSHIVQAGPSRLSFTKLLKLGCSNE